ncbi:MAG: hypothetical protein QUS08_00165 [Methanothrix sp.]|nr:hypothetical protein [Methanothrix sp.]
MILLVDLCYEKGSLSRYEFVHPIKRILERSGHPAEALHITDLEGADLDRYDRAILCGTALQDNAYASHPDQFLWLKGWKRPILGICAGMQVIGSLFGGRIVPDLAIGLERIEIVACSPLLGGPGSIEGYHLHRFCVTLPEGFMLLAGTPERPQAFLHRDLPVYGVLFHPEVRCRFIIERFAVL